jgi:hypothetical protein
VKCKHCGRSVYYDMNSGLYLHDGQPEYWCKGLSGTSADPITERE